MSARSSGDCESVRPGAFAVSQIHHRYEFRRLLDGKALHCGCSGVGKTEPLVRHGPMGIGGAPESSVFAAHPPVLYAGRMVVAMEAWRAQRPLTREPPHDDVSPLSTRRARSSLGEAAIQ